MIVTSQLEWKQIGSIDGLNYYYRRVVLRAKGVGGSPEVCASRKHCLPIVVNQSVTLFPLALFFPDVELPLIQTPQ